MILTGGFKGKNSVVHYDYLRHSSEVEGDRGSPGELGAGGVRETGEKRAGGEISTMAGSGREIKKGKLFLFVTAYFQSKKRTQELFLTSI